MANQWFKFWGSEYLSDPKMQSLTACERSCWLTLLAQASMFDEEGKVKYLTEDKLMIQAGISFQLEEWGLTKGVLEKFQKLGMITLDNDEITVSNWNKRQERSLTPYERVKRYRERKKNDNGDNECNNTKITTEEKRREEKRRDKEVAGAPLVIFERKIREKDEGYRTLVKDLAAKDYLSAQKIHKIVLEEFLPYWLEKGENAKKSRWEKEKAFDYQRRIRTWIKNIHERAKDYRCKSDMWHRNGDSCHCVKDAPEPRRVRSTEELRAIAAAAAVMKV